MSSSILEPAPSWEEINLAARVLLLPKFDLDLKQLGLAQRMKYEEFEVLFYHLFSLVDSQETRRRFKGPYPALDQEGRSRFIESAVRFINDKQLYGQRVASSQLRMYGGETFRRLVGSLIKIASERETSNLLSRQSIEDQVGFQQSCASLEIFIDNIEQLRMSLLKDEEELKDLRTKLSQLKAKVGESKHQEDERWQNLTRKLRDFSGPRDQSQALDLCTCLLSRLEASSGESKVALERLKAMKLPVNHEITSPRGAPVLQDKLLVNNSEKRLSQFIREAKAYMNSNQQVEESKSNNLGEKMRQQLVEFDDRMARWLEMLRDESEQADEALLKNPEALEKYKQLEQLIPLISLTSMVAPLGTFEAPDFDSLASVLAEFSVDSTCHTKQALEMYQAILNKQSKKL